MFMPNALSADIENGHNFIVRGEGGTFEISTVLRHSDFAYE